MYDTLFVQAILLLKGNQLASLGLSLVLAVLMAEVLHRLVRMPVITGYLLVGLLLGLPGAGVLDAQALHHLSLFSDIATGVLLFELGRHLDWHWLHNERRLLIMVLVESVAVFAAVYGLLIFSGVAPLPAGLLAVLTITTSPVILMPILRETRAEGRVSEWARVFAATNNALALVLTLLLIGMAQVSKEEDWQQAMLELLEQLGGAIALGLACGYVLTFSMRWLRRHGPRDVLPMLLLFGAIVACVGLANVIGVPPLLAVLSLGIASRNIGNGEALLGINIDSLRSLFICILFVQTGASLDLSIWRTIPVTALLLIVTRGIIRTSVPFLLAPYTGLRHAQGAWLGVVVMPMSSLAVLSMHSVMVAMPELRQETIVIGLTTLYASLFIGPLTTRWALQRAGEVPEALGGTRNG